MAENSTDKHRQKQENNGALTDSIEPPKDFKAYDREWLEKFQEMSFYKGLYAALAGATFFGLFSIITKMLIDKVGDSKEKTPFRFPHSLFLMGGMASIGVYFAYLSNVKESKIRKLEDDRLAHRIKAGEEPDEPQANTSPTDTPLSPAYSNTWRSRVVQQQQQKDKTSALMDM